MADECDISKMITTFLLNTSRLLSRLNQYSVEAAGTCGVIATAGARLKDEELKCFPLITGSLAEFYIEPMLPHVGDVDVMFYSNVQLAVPRGHPPPTQLPADFYDSVWVLEIIDSHFPCYVHLVLRYVLIWHNDDGKYDYIEYDGRLYLQNDYLQNDYYDAVHRHGPAILADNSNRYLLSIDAVHCIRCLMWPPQAADWPTRHRNYGWPDSATLDRVVSNGCDVVRVAHRQCRQHEWMNKHQHRLSFSRAEIVLINSWMPVQQITYHILRVYMKTERLTESADNSEPAIMSNYNIKTLMLWACELKPRSWWTENLNLVRICVELLHSLSVWLTDTRCPHYYCNLLDTPLSDGAVVSKLASIDEMYLSTWLMKNYIGQCAQLCPFYISRLFDDVSTSEKLQKAVSGIVRWRLSTSLYDLWHAINFAEADIILHISICSLTAHSCACWMNEFTKIDERLSVYFSAVALLHVACKISRNGFNDKLMDILSTILGYNFNQCCSVLSRCIAELNTSELVELLQKSAVEHLTTYRQLEARDFGSEVTFVTTDFLALLAVRRRCGRLSASLAAIDQKPVTWMEPLLTR